MGVYIKDMEMPKSCYKCPLRRRDGMDIVCPVAHERFSVADVNILEYRLNNCPLGPVPPHGRLIDADEAIGHLFIGEQCLYSWDKIEESIDATLPSSRQSLSKPCKDDDDIPICTKASPASLGIYKKAEEGE